MTEDEKSATFQVENVVRQYEPHSTPFGVGNQGNLLKATSDARLTAKAVGRFHPECRSGLHLSTVFMFLTAQYEEREVL